VAVRRFHAGGQVEGELGSAELHDLDIEAPPVIREAYVGDDDRGFASYDVVVTAEGQGDAHWHLSVLLARIH